MRGFNRLVLEVVVNLDEESMWMLCEKSGLFMAQYYRLQFGRRQMFPDDMTMGVCL